MPSPVVVDGRLTREKLDELLSLAAEYAELDFKATLDLRRAEHRLGLYKDFIAMMNTEVGGYIVVGANEDGTPARDREPIDSRRFDSADLAQGVARHLSVAPLITAQAHDVDGWPVVMIHVSSTASGLPALVSRIGEYQVENQKHTVLRAGALYVREGTRNVEATDGHWPLLLARYRASVLAEAREGLDTLIRRVVESTASVGGGVSQLPPLLLEMDHQSFSEALAQHFDASSDSTLQRFLRQAQKASTLTSGGNREARSNALDKTAIVAIEALRSHHPVEFEVAVAALHHAYISAGTVSEYPVSLTAADDVEVAQHWLDVLVRVYLIGAAAERDQNWHAIASIARRPVEMGEYDRYPTWLRHGIIFASRAHLFPDENRGGTLVLSRAREYAIQNPPLADDISVREMADATDPLLSSLARFDMLWCVVMAVGAGEDLEYLLYPSAAALDQERVNPVLRLVASNRAVQEALVPEGTDRDFAVALQGVLDLARKQSRNHGSFWRGVEGDRVVAAFVRLHTADSQSVPETI